MSTKRCWQCQCSSEGQVVACPGRTMDGDNRLATSEYVSADGDASPAFRTRPGWWQHLQQQHWSSSYSTLTQKNFWPITATLEILTEVVLGCATFNSPMHDNREVVLAVGGYEQATAQVLDYSQPKSQHGQQVITIHLYDCFIWLFCTIAGITTFCLNTVLSFILHPRDWCVHFAFVNQGHFSWFATHKHRFIDRYVI